MIGSRNLCIKIYIKVLRIALFRLLIVGTIIYYFDAVFFSQAYNCLGKADLFHFHEKFNNTTAFTAAEAVVHFPFWKHMKRRSFFIMKGTAAPPVRTAFIETGVFIN